MRVHFAGRALLALLLAAGLATPLALAPAAGADPRAPLATRGDRPGDARSMLERARRGGLRHPPPRSAPRDGLDAFAARRRLEAAAEVRALQREGARRMDRLHLEREAGPRAPASEAEVERARARWRRDAELDAVRTGVDLDALERRTGWRLGPFTRHILESRLRVEAHRDAREREAEGRALREATESREPEPGFLETAPRVPPLPERP